MKRTDATYGQLDKVLRSLGYSCRPSKHDPPGRVYEHKESGSIIILPAFDLSKRVYAHHLLTVQTDLDNFGLADPSVFAAELQKPG